MEQENLDNWEDFETRIESLNIERLVARSEHLGSHSHYLFRGQADSSWNLKTTLDRADDTNWSFSKYFRLISIARPQIETFTNNRWDIDNWPDLREWATKYDNLHSTQFPGYEYLVYLRHHGFPSPFLDWSRSPYVAAFFAFITPHSDRVAIYIYQEYSGHGKSGSSKDPQIARFGPYVRSHSRHFLQQSEYTIAAQYNDEMWHFAQHEDVFSRSEQHQDKLWKLTLPSTERNKVLRTLDAHNLNSFSLFQTEESLLKTIAVREIELQCISGEPV